VAFVLDASVAACWAFDDEDHPKASQALERLRSEEAYAPVLWRFEICNLLVVNERRGRIDERDAGLVLRSLARLPIHLDAQAVESDLLKLARSFRLSAYDAAYLELAARLGLPLATLDGRLAQAAQSAGVALL
jgi:predicted nucleic acid-binding protein